MVYYRADKNAKNTRPSVSPSPHSPLFFYNLLKSVSRSFYLSMRILPEPLRIPIGTAYLLARAADSIADTGLVVPERRLELLLAFRRRLAEANDLSALQTITSAIEDKQEAPDERGLLRALPIVFEIYHSLARPDHEKVRDVVATLTQGMEIDLRNFCLAEHGDTCSFNTEQDLDRYTYYVAGCVGEFWTRICMAHLPSLRHWSAETQISLGIHYGKALQLTNILRDVPQDLRIGRCYLPQEQLAEFGLTPDVLLDKENSRAAKPLLLSWINVATDYYQDATDYVTSIPRHHIRLRLATLWPMLIGLETLAKLAQEPDWLDKTIRVKISRGRVYRIMLVSLLVAPSNLALRTWTQRLIAKTQQPSPPCHPSPGTSSPLGR
jgi:farnesyl-diphosphate farnesyltransferase